MVEYEYPSLEVFLSWQYGVVIITNIINTVIDSHCFSMLYELGRNTLIVIILGVLKLSHYLDWISKRSAEVSDITCTFVINRKRDKERAGKKGPRGRQIPQSQRSRPIGEGTPMVLGVHSLHGGPWESGEASLPSCPGLGLCREGSMRRAQKTHATRNTRPPG